MKPIMAHAILGALCLFMAIPASAQEAAGEPVVLFNGEDLSVWNAQWEPNHWFTAAHVGLGLVDKNRFSIEGGKGILVNGMDGRTCNLYSEYQHGDCHLSIEFMVPHNSNSGVYFQGLYEVQVLDSWGKRDVAFSDCGGIYARFQDGRTYEGHPPRVNASNPPGEWQRFEVTFRAPRFNEDGDKIENARFIKVVHNGVVVHENVELTGNTRASMNRDESPKGPLMLQGDHGPVAYRNIVLTPLNLDETE